MAKKKAGRPPGRKAPHRPVLSTSARVSAEFYAEVTQAAQKFGRTISEELVWRAQQGFELEKAIGDAKKVIADAERAVEGSLRQAMRSAGFTPVYSGAGTYWLEPGMPPVPLAGHLAPEVRAAITEAVRQALAEKKEGGS